MREYKIKNSVVLEYPTLNQVLIKLNRKREQDFSIINMEKATLWNQAGSLYYSPLINNTTWSLDWYIKISK